MLPSAPGFILRPGTALNGLIAVLSSVRNTDRMPPLFKAPDTYGTGSGGSARSSVIREQVYDRGMPILEQAIQPRVDEVDPDTRFVGVHYDASCRYLLIVRPQAYPDDIVAFQPHVSRLDKHPLEANVPGLEISEQSQASKNLYAQSAPRAGEVSMFHDQPPVVFSLLARMTDAFTSRSTNPLMDCRLQQEQSTKYLIAND